MLIEYGQKNICLWSREELSFIVGLCFSGNICIDMFYLYEMVMVADDSGGMRVNFNISTWKELEVMLVLFYKAQSGFCLRVCFLFLMFVAWWNVKG